MRSIRCIDIFNVLNAEVLVVRICIHYILEEVHIQKGSGKIMVVSQYT